MRHIPNMFADRADPKFEIGDARKGEYGLILPVHITCLWKAGENMSDDSILRECQI